MDFKRLIIIVLAILIVSACNDDNDYTNDYTGNNKQEEITISEDIQRLSSQLFGTSWKFYKLVDIDGKVYNTWPIECVITFSNEPADKDCYYAKINGRCYSNAIWWIDNNGLSYYLTNAYSDLGLSAFDAGAWSVSGGHAVDAQIIKKTSSELVVKEDFYGSIGGRHYINTIYFNSASSSGGSSGGGSYEAPEIGFYDFTATRTSLKVQYRIYDGEVTNAKIYYGTSSPSISASTSIIGKMIIADISGLKSGTKYYVKCIASGPGGSTTSSTTACITNY